jgi:hypothetical protein
VSFESESSRLVHEARGSHVEDDVLWMIPEHAICNDIFNLRVQSITITARWPSGLRRQLKVVSHPIRWSERAWVQIPLSSSSLLLVTCILLLSSEGGGMRRKNRGFVILDVGFVWTVDPFFLCAWVMKPVCDGLAFCASF